MTQGEIDSVAATFAAVKAIYNGDPALHSGVVGEWTKLAALINANLPAFRALGLDPSACVAGLSAVARDINPAGLTIKALIDKVAAMVADPSPTPTPSPPPTPAPSPTGVRANPSLAHTNFLYASVPLGAPWVVGGGDYVDRDGVFNGHTPAISQTITPGTLTFDISGIDGDLFIRGIDSWDTALIDGQPTDAFWLHLSSDLALGMPAKWGAPGMIMNPTRGKTLTINTPGAGYPFTPGTVSIDKVAGPPIVQEYPMVGPSNVPDVLDFDLVDEASINTLGPIAQPFAYEPEFLVDPSGMKYLRFAATTQNPRLISWFVAIGQRETACIRYVLYIEDDVADGMTEKGMKLPGLSNDPSVGVPMAELISWRLEHGPVDQANRNFYSLVDYLYDAESGDGYGTIEPMGGVILRSGRYYVLEERVRLNTPGVSDGYGEVLVNGHSMWRSDTAKWRNSADTKLTCFHVNVYHGGLGFPSKPFHLRIAKLGVSSGAPIGVPAELLGLVPTPTPTPTPVPPPPPTPTPTPVPAPSATDTRTAKWRNGLPVGTPVEIPNTSMALMRPATWPTTVDAWCGLAMVERADEIQWVALAGGGHADGNDNGVYGIDLLSDSPAFGVLCPPSALADRWTEAEASFIVDASGKITDYQTRPHNKDGKPASRHNYFSPVDCAKRNRIFLPFATALWYSAQSAPTMDGFDWAKKQWDPAGTWPNAPIMNYEALVQVHPVTGDIYIADYGWRTAKWDGASGTWGPVFTALLGGAGALIDVPRNRLVRISGQKSSTVNDIGYIVQMDLATHLTTEVTTGLAGEPLLRSGENIVHDTRNDQYYGCTAEGRLYRFDPATLQGVKVLTLPFQFVNGVWSRFAYSETLRGLLFYPYFASNLWFMATE